MSTDDMLSLAVTVDEYFPQAAKGDAREVWTALEAFTLTTAREAIRRHRLELGSEVYRPDIRRLAFIARGIERTKLESVEAGRLNGETAEAKAARRAQEEELQRRQDEARRIVDALPDARLDQLTQDALATLPDAQRELCRRLGPKHSRTLREAIAELVKAETPHQQAALPGFPLND